MKVIIAGSRGINDLQTVWDAMAAFGNRPSQIVSGTAPGVDRLGERWALGHGIEVARFPAAWSNIERPGAVIRYRNGVPYDAAAGNVRNKQMADYADALVAIWDGKSPGTKDMIDAMKARGKPVYIYTPRR